MFRQQSNSKQGLLYLPLFVNSEEKHDKPALIILIREQDLGSKPQGRLRGMEGEGGTEDDGDSKLNSSAE